MNDLQRVELDILKEFITVCSDLHLRYYLVCGSALGAVKYGGFIPWDDDIDVGMPREDYELFLANAQKRLPSHLFLQNYRTDKNFPHVFSKLRNSQTTLLESGSEHLEMNHGIYIDIFPLDGYPKEESEKIKLRKKKKYLTWKQYCTLKGDSPPRVVFRNKIFRILGYHKRTAKTLAKMDALISRWPTAQAEVWCNHGNWQGEREYAPKWHYGAGTKATFEGVEVIVPEQYDAYFTQKYGDWRADPPEDKQVSHHMQIAVDTKTPYTQYRKQHTKTTI